MGTLPQREFYAGKLFLQVSCASMKFESTNINLFAAWVDAF